MPAGAGSQSDVFRPTIDRTELHALLGLFAAIAGVAVIMLALGSIRIHVHDLTHVNPAWTASEQDRGGPYPLEAGIDPMTALDQAIPAAINPIVGQDQPGTSVTSADCEPGSSGQAVCTIGYSDGMTQQQTVGIAADGQTFTLPASFMPAITS